MKNNLSITTYYLLCALIVYGNYHIIFVLDKSLWWLVSLILIEYVKPTEK